MTSQITKGNFYLGQQEVLRLWFSPYQLIREPEFLKKASKYAILSRMGDRELKGQLALYINAMDAHVEASLTKAMEAKALDLSHLDSSYDAKLEVDGTELGDLEELKGNAGEKAAIEVRNYRRRRLSFYFMQRHMALLFFVFDILDPSLAAKGFDLLVHDWSEDRLTELTAHKRAAVLWKLLLEILNRGRPNNKKTTPAFPC